MSSNTAESVAESHGRTSSFGLLVAAAGVVYGDIGTSPLYTLKEVFAGHYGVRVDAEGVLGILSLILWSLLWVVSLTAAGYWFGNVPWIKQNLTLVILGIIAVSFVPVVIGWWQHRKGEKTA